jgi:hypothetical protein
VKQPDLVYSADIAQLAITMAQLPRASRIDVFHLVLAPPKKSGEQQPAEKTVVLDKKEGKKKKKPKEVQVNVLYFYLYTYFRFFI